jgi:hypothetical protein
MTGIRTETNYTLDLSTLSLPQLTREACFHHESTPKCLYAVINYTLPRILMQKAKFFSRRSIRVMMMLLLPSALQPYVRSEATTYSVFW